MRFCLFLMLLLPISTLAQFKGLWNGYITHIENDQNSNYVLDIKEESDGIVKGDAYIFKNKYVIFEGKLNFIGTIKEQTLVIKELKILYSKTPKNLLLCFKNMELMLIAKNGIENLTGPWNGSIYNSGMCIPGDVFLRKYNQDFLNGFEDIPKAILKSIQTAVVVPDTFITTNLSVPKIIEVKSKAVLLSIKDYQKVDGDIISVYLDRNVILSKHQLNRKTITKKIRVDQKVSLSELIIFAENLGKIPPNTCMMIVDDGFSKQEVFIESSLQKSAVIYLKYTFPD